MYARTSTFYIHSIKLLCVCTYIGKQCTVHTYPQVTESRTALSNESCYSLLQKTLQCYHGRNMRFLVLQLDCTHIVQYRFGSLTWVMDAFSWTANNAFTL